jgi:hypothetical protein
MNMMPVSLAMFAKQIMNLPAKDRYSKEDLLTPEFLIHKQGNIEIYYSPHNEYVNKMAKLVIVGITPGWTQMEQAIRMTKGYLEAGKSYIDILKSVKRFCRFSGSMRHNLIEMMDEIGLPSYLGIYSMRELFEESDGQLHTTSLIRYPVFVNHKNYTGYNPVIKNIPYLFDYVRDLSIRYQPFKKSFSYTPGANGHRVRTSKGILSAIKI